ncbi:transposase [Streptomyces sp. NPDC002285]
MTRRSVRAGYGSCWTGKSAAEVARDLGVHEGTLQTWVHWAKVRAAAEAAEGLDESEREELHRLREENKQLRKENSEIGMERDVLRRSGPTAFGTAFSGISPRPRRHLMTAGRYRLEMTIHFTIWNHNTGTVGQPTMA